MNALETTLIIVVKASLLIAAAGGVNLLMRGKTSAASRHLVWTLALAGVLVLPFLSFAVPTWGIPIRVASTACAAPVTTPVTEWDRAWAAETAAMEAASPSLPEASSSTTVALPASTTPAPSTWSLSSLSGTQAALAIYLLGVVVLSLRLAHGRWTLRRLVNQSVEVTDPSWRALLRECESAMGVTQPVRLLRSLDRNMPMAFGIVTPTILIPAIADTWSDDRRRAVLLHEMAHIDRRDCMTQLLAAITCAAYWMHPAVWWVALRLRVERELACDDRVVSAGTSARDYAAHLLELAYSLGGYRSPALVVSMARPRQLEGRMLAVLDAARNRVAPPVRTYALGAAVMAAFVLPLAAAEAVVIEEPTTTQVTVDARSTGSGSSSSSSASTAASYGSAAHSTSESSGAHGGATVDQEPPAPPAPPVPPVHAARSVFEVPPIPPPAPLAPLSPLAPLAEERRREIKFPGTWEVRKSENDENKAHLRLSERQYSMSGFEIPLDQLEGLSQTVFIGESGNAKFQIKRDAGTIVFEGVFRSGIGAGTFDFTPNPTFPAEMKRRGFDAPNTTDQYLLARSNIGFAYLDELNAQKYEKPTLEELVRAGDHGVHFEYLKAMGAAGYTFGKLSALVRTRDHGVTPAYIKAMADAGFTNLTADQLLRAKDHGVSAQYAGTMKALGYNNLSLDDLVRARDHGVSVEFIRGMAEAGYSGLSLEKLTRARDHGVSSEFVKAMREAGYGALSLDELINARDHGVSAEYVREISKLGPERPSIQELVQARDHGVGADFARAWRDLGYAPILADMVQARQHGVSADFIKELKALGYDQLSVEQLVRLRNHGISAGFVRDANERSTSRLTVDELVRRRNGRF